MTLDFSEVLFLLDEFFTIDEINENIEQIFEIKYFP
jgi:hypothetical protein